MKPWIVGLAALTMVVGNVQWAAADHITDDVGTAGNAANWKITGAGATDATAFQVSDGISLTSNNFRTGTFVTGGSLAAFNGLWWADLQFFLPADATNVTLTFSGLAGDDREVLELNGTIIGNSGIFAPGLGMMSFPPGPPVDAPFDFTDITSGTITLGFLPGQMNTLRGVVNNTFSGIHGSTKTFQTDADGTIVGVAATLTYDTPTAVPEIDAGLLASACSVLGGGVLILRGRRRR
jgi:hypothetical protein